MALIPQRATVAAGGNTHRSRGFAGADFGEAVEWAKAHFYFEGRNE